jgi:ABC-type transport system involved in multi-copper enzyme maturation permease subunit
VNSLSHPNMKHPVFSVAHYVLVEAMRSGLPWLALGGALAVLCLAGFLSQVAITEAAALQAAVAAALLRACAVFLLAAHVVASVIREANDKGLELALALPISRPTYYLGKLLGFVCAGLALASWFALPLLLWSRSADLAAWWLTLCAEAALVAAAALFFASVLQQVVAAIAATAGLYLLARAMPAIQAIASGPLAEESATASALRAMVDVLALLLPRLDLVVQSEWLLYGAPPALQLAQALLGLAIFGLLLVAAGLFDFTRRNL